MAERPDGLSLFGFEGMRVSWMPVELPWNAVLALGSAALWGGGDFTGGMGVRTTGGSVGGALRVVLMSHAASFCTLAAVAWVRGDGFPHGAVLAWGVAGGMVGGLSIVLFYLALSRGAMGAAAAVSGLLAAAIPALVSVGVEGRPGVRQVLGFGAAALAIWLIAGSSGEERVDRGTMGLAITSGAGFGVYFVCLKFAAAGGIVWAMGSARIGSLSLCAVMLGVWVLGKGRGDAILVRRAAFLWALGSAVMDTSGNMLFMAATRAGRLDVAAVLASLYPASTILLAACVLKESPTRRQGWGMGVAVGAVVLIAA